MLYRLFLLAMIPVSFVWLMAVMVVCVPIMIVMLPVFAVGYVLGVNFSLTDAYDSVMQTATAVMFWVQDEMDRA